MALSQTSVLKLYNTVIEDVINGVRDAFIDDGVDEQVLQELKQIWETKLLASKAVELNPDPPEPQPPQLTYKNPSKGGSKSKPKNASNAQREQQREQQLQQQLQQQQQQQQQLSNQNQTPQSQVSEAQPQPQQIISQQQLLSQMPPVQSVATNMSQSIPQHSQPQQPQPSQSLPVQQPVQPVQQPMQHIQAPSQQVLNTPPVGVPDPQMTIQIKLPAHQNLPERVITVHVPHSATQGNRLQSIFSGPIITAAIGLPAPFATSLIQQHINTTFEGHAGFVPPPVQHPLQLVTQASNAVPQQIIQNQQQGNIAQLDGAHAGDTSDEEDEDDDDDDDDNDEDDDDDLEREDEENDTSSAREEEPLNSEDDVTDDDPTDLFDTDNVVVCQYDKITRTRNKWKFYLKDGIMNLSGKDFVFQKANGDAEW